MNMIHLRHPDDINANFGTKLPIEQFPQGLSIPEACVDHLTAMNIDTSLRHNGMILIPAERVADYARLRLYGHPVKWIFDMYHFPGGFRPYAHQRTGFDLTVCGILAGKRVFNLSEMAVGKTATTVWALHALMVVGHVERVLVLTTKSTLIDPWLGQWSATAMNIPTAALTGSKPARQKIINSNQHRVLIANHHAANALKIELAKWSPTIVVIDEATVIKTASSLIHKNMRYIAHAAKAVILMTGTPTSNSLLDSHGLLLMAGVPNTPTSISKFKMEYGFPTGPFSHQWFHDSQQRIVHKMFPQLAYKKRDCIDLPPQIDIFRNVGMSKDQEHAYNDLVQEFVHEARSATGNNVHTVTAVNALSLMTKLMQVASGIVKGLDADGNMVDVVVHPADKIDELTNAINQTERKVLIFASYKSVIYNLEALLKKKYGAEAVVAVTGDMNMVDRGNVIAHFQNLEHPLKIVVAHPQVLALGVTMTAADLTVWFSPSIRTELYLQGKERISRPGQTAEKTTQLHIMCSDIEREVYTKQAAKIRTQDVLLDQFRSLTKRHGIAVAIQGDQTVEDTDTLGTD